MVFLDGEPPALPTLVVSVIRPDGSVTHVDVTPSADDWHLPYADFSQRYLEPAIAAIRAHAAEVSAFPIVSDEPNDAEPPT